MCPCQPLSKLNRALEVKSQELLEENQDLMHPTIKDKIITHYTLKWGKSCKETGLHYRFPTWHGENNCNCNWYIRYFQGRKAPIITLQQFPQQYHAVKFPVTITENISWGRKRWKTNGEKIRDFWCRFFTVYAEFLTVSKGRKRWKNISLLIWAFSRLVFHGLPPSRIFPQNEKNGT